MIKIERNNLASIIKDHYNRVCLDSKNGAKGLVTKIRDRITNEVDVNRIDFYNILLQDASSPNSLIDGSPNYLEARINFYEKTFRNLLTPAFKEDLLNNLFFYGSYSKWGDYKLSQALSVNVCPYCNRQYTFTVETTSGKTRPQFDHFFDKATYPYLSLSFFNLIPSCSICNSSLKGNAKFSLARFINPYLESFGGYIRFSINPNKVSFINGVSSSYDVIFKFDPKASKQIRIKAARHIVLFKLRELYNQHKDYIDEIIIKSRIYNEDYIKALFEQHKGTLFSNISDVKRMIVSNYIAESDLDKRVLSKMAADISNELGLI